MHNSGIASRLLGHRAVSRARIDIPRERIAEFGRRNHIRRLALWLGAEGAFG